MARENTPGLRALSNSTYLIPLSTGWEHVRDRVVAISLSTGKIALFDKVEAEIWCLLAEGHTTNEISSSISLRYEVSSSQASSDVQEFLTSLENQGFIESRTIE